MVRVVVVSRERVGCSGFGSSGGGGLRHGSGQESSGTSAQDLSEGGPAVSRHGQGIGGSCGKRGENERKRELHYFRVGGGYGFVVNIFVSQQVVAESRQG